MRNVKLIDPSIPPGRGRVVPILALYGLDTLVQAGSTVEIPDDVAGTPPTENDPGSGLLAQSDIWAEGEDA